LQLGDVVFRGFVVSLAYVASVAFPVSWFTHALNDRAIRVLSLGLAVALIAVFFRLVIDPGVRRAVETYRAEMMRQRGGKFWISPFDRESGLFGRRVGSMYLIALRAILFIEFLAALIFGAPSGSLWIASVGFGIATCLVIFQLKFQYKAAP
jgi:hypothetical protein